MPKSPMSAFTNVAKKTINCESSATQRRHAISCIALVACTCFEKKAAASAAFPTRVDLAPIEPGAVTAERQQFFERKYLLDRCFGGVLLVLFSPIIVALYVLVRVTSRGPGLFKQERVGLNGKTFEIIKLRSMVHNAEQPGRPQWAVKGDARVNLVGRVLRKLHLDELPQLYNVTCGEMSLVGPRPERPQICDELARKINGYYSRTVVKPGITGLAQINLPPDESIDDVRRKQILDLNYIANAGFWLDIRMVIATALRMFGLQGTTVMQLMQLDRTHLTKDIGTSEVHMSSLPAQMVRSSARSDAMMDTRTNISSANSLSDRGSSSGSTHFSFANHSR